MDTRLSEVGLSQARDVGESLKNLQIDAMFCSDLKRASDTAESIRKCYERAFVPLHPNPLMRERNFGLNNGQPRSKIHEFIAKAKASHNGCEMWREVQAECGHQVSHGQWIREFNHTLQVLPQRTRGFPTQKSMVAVLSNCQFNQYGVAVDCARLAERAASVRAAVESAESRHLSRPKACPYEVDQLSDWLPVGTVCYHARVDANTVEGLVTSAPAVVVATSEEEVAEGKKPAPTGSGVETLYFAREDDEYAGMPPAK